MKGVIIAGGLGTRLAPFTQILCNKHLLPIYDKPMFWYPLNTLLQAGLKDIIIVTSPQDQDKFKAFIPTFGLAEDIKIDFATQEVGDRGIADALLAAEPFVGDNSMAVILGDNIFGKSILTPSTIENFKHGAKIFLSLVDHDDDWIKAKAFGCPKFEGRKIVDLIEKPEEPPSPFAVTGLYLLDNLAFEHLKTLQPSNRNQLEITDLLKCYLSNLEYDKLYMCFWTDAGTFENLYLAQKYVFMNLKDR